MPHPDGDEDAALRALAQRYLDAAYAMDAVAFASVFDPASSVTRLGDDGEVRVLPLEAWLAVVRTTPAPSQRGDARADELLAVHQLGELAVVTLRLRVAPRTF